jgi:Holliday junction resolvasome RuvABC endonuclease subunit
MPKKKAQKPAIDLPAVLTEQPLMKPILGLDLGLANSGWSMYYPGITLNIPGMITGMQGGSISPESGNPSDPFTEMRRIKTILGKIRGLIIGECAPKPLTRAGLVVIEGFSFGSMNTQAHKIGGLGYLVRYMVWRHEIPYLIVSPAEVKKFATGKSKAEKSLILKQTLKVWKVDLNDDNEADAFVLTMIGRALTGTWEPETEPQREVLRSLVARNSGLLGTPQLPGAVPCRAPDSSPRRVAWQ